MESCFIDHFSYLVKGLAVTAACLYLRNRRGAKCLFLKIYNTHCEKVVFAFKVRKSMLDMSVSGSFRNIGH